MSSDIARIIVRISYEFLFHEQPNRPAHPPFGRLAARMTARRQVKQASARGGDRRTDLVHCDVMPGHDAVDQRVFALREDRRLRIRARRMAVRHPLDFASIAAEMFAVELSVEVEPPVRFGGHVAGGWRARGPHHKQRAEKRGAGKRRSLTMRA
jgi:hypothetical protein